MKHILLTQLDSEIHQIIEVLEKPQALTLAALSISRLWHPFEKWAVQNKSPKLIEWGTECINILWEQIICGQLYGQDFEKYHKCLNKINAKMDWLEDREIVVEGSTADPFLDSLGSALRCFFDPKLLPGLRRHSFGSNITAIVGQGAEYIYDDIFTNADTISEHDLISMVETDSRWKAEHHRILDDVSFVKDFQQDKQAILKRKEKYMRLDIFIQ